MEYKFDDMTEYFIISDLHGQGKIYDYIVDHFDKEATKTNKKIVLIINGDIIDRGNDSIRMLVDIMDRVKNGKGNIKIVMLPGNHEEMMCSALEYRRVNGKWDHSKPLTVNNIWFADENGGRDTCQEYLKLPPARQEEVLEFLKSLPLFFRIKSDIPGYNSYVVIHAGPPKNAMTAPRIPTLGDVVTNPKAAILRICLNYRKGDNDPNVSLPDKGVITIIGHTPVETFCGFNTKENNKLLMIDGGCAFMANNPNSLTIPEMATLVRLSEVPGKTDVFLYGEGATQFLREGKRR